MISFDLKNLYEINPKHGLSQQELESKKELISTYLEKIHARKQGFYECIDDNSLVEKINDFAHTHKNNFEYFVILGIGGSALGAICLKESLAPHTNLFILDNIDPVLITDLESQINLQKTLFIVITKSGATPETLSQYFYFREKCTPEQFVFITDPKKGLLRQLADKEGIASFDIPENIGGRFSVLTAVGLLPAALIGLKIDNLLTGAKNMRQKFLNENFSENLPFQFATIQYLLDQKDKNINVMMPYTQRLIRLADWYRQLLAESIGKNNHGLTPVNALGVTDQHSQSQLYNDGPNDKLITFIEVADLGPELHIPAPDTPEVSFLKNLTFNKLLQTEKTATAQSLTKNHRPNITIKVDSVNEEALGELFMLFEASIAFLGEFYDINAFDQPGVELSKKLTKELLLK